LLAGIKADRQATGCKGRKEDMNAGRETIKHADSDYGVCLIWVVD